MATNVRSNEWLARNKDVIIIIIFICLALYNVIELNFKILGTFKRYRGLYFWSFSIGTWGVAFNGVGYLLRTLSVVDSPYIYATVLSIGWISMINCQSLVLYSRLHIVVHSGPVLRAVLVMIVINAVWIDIPLTVLNYGTMSSNPQLYKRPYKIYENIQLPVIFVQELIIGYLYVYETFKLRTLRKGLANDGTRRVMNHLILVNIFIIVLDVTILGLQYAGLYNIQTAWKPLVYSIKLKLEFSILNRLVEMTQEHKMAQEFGSNSGFGSIRRLSTNIGARGDILNAFGAQKDLKWRF